MPDRTYVHTQSAYGGDGWRPRTRTTREEIGALWGACGASSEWSRLRAVLLHRPGAELAASLDFNAVNMLEPLDVARAQAQHDAMAQVYRDAGVAVYYAEPEGVPTPNQMFMADLFFMTPEGAILARPASEVRAGEERWAARRLAELGVPILRSVSGEATFEGADAMWIDPRTVILGRGLRTNDAGAAQVTAVLREMGVEVVQVDMPFGTMHLMGMLRIVDRDLAIAWPTRFVHRGVEALRARGYRVVFLPDEREPRDSHAFNFVTLGPREILMPGGNPRTQTFYESLGIACRTVAVDELSKAAGAIGCLTGVVERAPVPF
ncbi:MAG TPA: arginine deiminase family protein [Roseiflexaceae bacterium]|nr:arginine deiminase family protein [Roseiflexaceae bacterium]